MVDDEGPTSYWYILRMKPIQIIAGATTEQVVTSVEGAVTAGDLRADQRLPSIRDLADQLGVANGTVAAAYARLRDRGVVHTDGRRGTRVRARSVALPRRDGLAVPTAAVDLSLGNPDPALLPDLGPHLAGAHHDAGLYGEDPDPFLHAGLADLLRRRAAVDGVRDEHLTVVSGALDGVERTLAVHLRPGDAVAVEDPGWPNLLDLVAAHGLVAVPLPVDDHGPTVDGMAAVVDRVEAVVVTSRSQNPTGGALDATRRDQLAGILRGRDLLVVEDDHGGESSGVELAPLAGVTRRWAVVQSLSKSWGPDLRVAGMFGDAHTLVHVAGRFRLGPGWVSRLLQATAASLLADPAATATVAAAGVELAHRRDRLRAALAAHGIAARGRSGLNLWVAVPDEATVVAGLLGRGWGVAPGSRFRQAAGPGIRVTAAAVDTAELADAFARDLATVLAGPPRRGV